MSAAMTETTTLSPALPVSEDITLKPNKQFRRMLQIYWGACRSTVSVVQPGNWHTLASARVDNKQISLWAHRVTLLGHETRVVYSLDAGNVAFYLTQREFETLRAKLEPRGVKVELPKDETP